MLLLIFKHFFGLFLAYVPLPSKHICFSLTHEATRTVLKLSLEYLVKPMTDSRPKKLLSLMKILCSGILGFPSYFSGPQ